MPFSLTIGPGATDYQYLVAEADNVTGENVLLGAVTVTPSSVPEPSTLAIAGLGGLGFGAYHYRRRRATRSKA